VYGYKNVEETIKNPVSYWYYCFRIEALSMNNISKRTKMRIWMHFGKIYENEPRVSVSMLRV